MDVGEGAFSFVYTGLDPYQSRKFALKKIFLNCEEYDQIAKVR
jgi:hypothetical protein